MCLVFFAQAAQQPQHTMQNKSNRLEPMCACTSRLLPGPHALVAAAKTHPPLSCPADGRFRGWVSPAVCKRYGVPPTPDAAWEAGGGGSFSFKIDKSGAWFAAATAAA